MKDPVRMVFVGCGGCLRISFGPVLPFVDGLEVVAAVDPNDEALALAQDEYGIPMDIVRWRSVWTRREWLPP